MKIRWSIRSSNPGEQFDFNLHGAATVAGVTFEAASPVYFGGSMQPHEMVKKAETEVMEKLHEQIKRRRSLTLAEASRWTELADQ